MEEKNKNKPVKNRVAGNADAIIEALFEGSLPEELQDRVRSWYFAENNREDKDAAMESMFDKMVNEEAPTEWAHRSFEELERRIGGAANRNETSDDADIKRQGAKVTLKRKIVFRVAAVVMPLLILAGVTFLVVRGGKDTLSNIQVAYYKTVSASTGSPKQLNLPDGSVVYVNADSRLTFGEDFIRERNVKLEGEAYFYVAKQDGKPFVVETENLSVKVLGTEFNLRDYGESEQAVVSLNSGRVEVTTNDRVVTLEPSEQLVYSETSGEVEITEFDPYDVMEWMAVGMLMMDNITLEAAFGMVAEHFGVEMMVNGTLRGTKTVRLTFDKRDRLDDILYIIRQITDNFDYEIDEGQGRVTILPR